MGDFLGHWMSQVWSLSCTEVAEEREVASLCLGGGWISLLVCLFALIERGEGGGHAESDGFFCWNLRRKRVSKEASMCLKWVFTDGG